MDWQTDNFVQISDEYMYILIHSAYMHTYLSIYLLTYPYTHLHGAYQPVLSTGPN